MKYTMLSGIEEDPDFHKIATSTLVKFKLRQDFNIPIDQLKVTKQEKKDVKL